MSDSQGQNGAEKNLSGGVITHQDSVLKSLDDFNNHLADLFERYESRKWPPIPVWDKYVRGTLGVIIKLDVATGGDVPNIYPLVTISNNDVSGHLYHGGSVPVEHHKIGGTGCPEADIESGMFISNVEHIKKIEHVSLSVWEDFKLDKSVFYPITGTYHSFATGFKINPVIPRGEFEVLILRPTIDVDCLPSEVVERTTEVVSSIAYYEGDCLGRMFDKFNPDLNLLGMRLVMDNKSVRLSCNKLSNFGLKIADVMIGPFDL